MASPDYLNTTVCAIYFLNTTGMTDVNTIISDLRNVLVTQLGWTEPTTARFKSRVDSSGHFLDVLVTRVTATNVEFLVRDYRGSTLYDRRIQIDATASVSYYGSYYGFLVDSLRATSEVAWASLLEPSPDGLGDCDNRIAGTAYRSTADSIDAQGTNVGQVFTFNNGAAGSSNQPQLPWRSTSGSDRGGTSGAGTLLYEEILIGISQGGTIMWTGRPYQMIFVDSGIASQSDKVVPVDDAGSTGTFRVTGAGTANTGKYACRKA